jgi:N-carbamoylputrescine amidase
VSGAVLDQSAKIAVCEFPDEQEFKERAWAALVDYVDAVGPSIVVLPEMPFCNWIFGGDAVDNDLWREAVERHDAMIARLSELACRWVMSSRPVEEDGQRFNEAFIWSASDGYRPIRREWYLPEAPTAQETRWFNKGDCNFAAVRADALCVGFPLCSEMMFTEHARDMGFDGAHLVVQPRASGRGARWRIASEMAAIASGGYVASSNRRSFSHDLFAGGSWLLSPDAHVLCETTKERPFATVAIDVAAAERAKLQYPRDLYRSYRV